MYLNQFLDVNGNHVRIKRRRSLIEECFDNPVMLVSTEMGKYHDHQGCRYVRRKLESDEVSYIHTFVRNEETSTIQQMYRVL